MAVQNQVLKTEFKALLKAEKAEFNGQSPAYAAKHTPLLAWIGSATFAFFAEGCNASATLEVRLRDDMVPGLRPGLSGRWTVVRYEGTR